MKSFQMLILVLSAVLATSSEIRTQDGGGVQVISEEISLRPVECKDVSCRGQVVEVRSGKAVDDKILLTGGDISRPKEETYIQSIGSKYCPKPDGRNTFQNSCHRFVICSNGQLSQFGRCPTGQVFEPAISNCIDIGRAVRRDCSGNQRGGRTAAIQRYCRQALDKLTSHGKTPRFGDRDLFALPADPCRRFVTCAVDGHFQIGSCPRGTAFAPRLRKCILKRNVRNAKCQN